MVIVDSHIIVNLHAIVYHIHGKLILISKINNEQNTSANIKFEVKLGFFQMQKCLLHQTKKSTTVRTLSCQTNMNVKMVSRCKWHTSHDIESLINQTLLR